VAGGVTGEAQMDTVRGSRDTIEARKGGRGKMESGENVTIRQMIEKLESVAKRHGDDIPVCIVNYHSDYYNSLIYNLDAAVQILEWEEDGKTVTGVLIGGESA
jgi:hypothetical protein